MAYRDDLEAAQARIAMLEQENAELKDKSTALVKSPSTALIISGDQLGKRRWLGGPTKLATETVLDGELPETAFAVLIDHVRDVLGAPGQTSVLPGSVTWNQVPTATRAIEVRITSRHNKTTLRVSENLNGWAGGIYAGVGSISSTGASVAGATLGLAGLGVALVAGAGLWLGARKLFGGMSDKYLGQIHDLSERLAELAKEEIEQAQLQQLQIEQAQLDE